MNELLLSAAEVASSPSWWDRLLQPQVIVFLVPISAILGGMTVAIIKSIIRHQIGRASCRERV